MKVLWLLDELGLTYQRIEAGLQFGVNDTAAFRAMNPFGLVPVLQDGAAVIFESNTILRYLCEAHAPGSTLFPANPADRARVGCWMDAQLAAFAPLGTVFRQLVRVPPGQRDLIALDAALEPTSAAFAVLDGHLVGRDYLAGDAMTLADVAIGPLVHRWFALKLVRPDAPGLRAYYRRLLQRPAYVARCTAPLS